MSRLTTILSATLLALCLGGLSEAAPRGGRGGPQAGGGQGGQQGPQAGRGGRRGPRAGKRGRRGRRGPQGRRGGQQGPMQKIFARLDADKDGKISAAEAAAAGATRAAQIMAADANNDGFVTLDELRAYARQQQVTNMFSRLDKNNDGALDASELGRKGARLLQAADKDGDGKLTMQEVTDYLAAQATARQTRRQNRQQLLAAFKAADADNDRKLSAAEWPAGASATHAAVDADSDGSVTPREVAAYVRANNGNSPF